MWEISRDRRDRIDLNRVVPKVDINKIFIILLIAIQFMFFSRYRILQIRILCWMWTRCSHLEQDNTLIYLDEHRIYRYIPYYTIIVSVAKKPSDFRNKMYYIFGEYKVHYSNVTLLYHVGGNTADNKVRKLYV